MKNIEKNRLKSNQSSHDMPVKIKAAINKISWWQASLVSLLMIGNVQASDQFSPTFWANGFLMLDHDVYQGYLLNGEQVNTSESQIRRSRLNLETQLTESLAGRLHVAYDQGAYRLLDSYIRFSRWKIGNITIGKQKEPFGFENIMSARDMTMMERSLITAAVVPGRSPGVNLSGEGAAFNWQLGFYQQANQEETHAITGRLTWTGWQNPKSTFHLGMAFSERDFNGKEYSVNEVLDINMAEPLMDNSTVSANSVSLTGLEMMWQKYGFTSLAEWQQATITDVTNDMYEYQGGYVQMSYLLSGLNRDYRRGLLRKLATSKDWEVSMRWSQMQLVIEELEAETLTLGINYHLNSNAKIMLHYMKTKYNESYVEENDGQSFSLRAQYVF